MQRLDICTDSLPAPVLVRTDASAHREEAGVHQVTGRLSGKAAQVVIAGTVGEGGQEPAARREVSRLRSDLVGRLTAALVSAQAKVTVVRHPLEDLVVGPTFELSD
jgi:hypothetical protein